HFYVDAGKDFRIARKEFGLRLGGGEKIGDVTSPIAQRRLKRVFPLAPLNEISRARERRDQLPCLTPQVPAAMVEVEVRVNDDVHIAQNHAVLAELRRKTR